MAQSSRVAEIAATHCEAVLLIRDEVRERVSRLEKKTTVILVAHLGRGESSDKLSLRRLSRVSRMFSDGFRMSILETRGDAADGLGRLDVYVQGELVDAVYFARNVGDIDCSDG